MEIALDILKLILPAGIVFATAYYLVKNFLDSEHKKRLMEMRFSNQNKITPIRLQAYERITLFLERITPNNLVMRVQKEGMTAKALHIELLKTIRSEFEHNLAQQIYMSQGAWEIITTAKEETLKIVHLAATQLPENASSLAFCQAIIQLSSGVSKLPTQRAIEYLKKEIKQLF